MDKFTDMFKYAKLRKSDNKIVNYFGINEVVLGEFSSRGIRKKETTIDRALAYVFHPKVKEQISHMSLQSYATYLKKGNRVNRSEDEGKYYPFVVEFEKGLAESAKRDAYTNAMILVNGLIMFYNVNKEDIVITINNRKSVYVWVNPKVFGASPSPILHKVYAKMCEHIRDEFGLKYIDNSVTNTSHRLIKTPGSFYNGGFVNYITLAELNKLVDGELKSADLTKVQRDIRLIKLPSVPSIELTKLYKECKEDVEGSIKKNKVEEKNKGLLLPGTKEELKYINRPCVKALLSLPIIEKGNRNNALVTIALGLLEKNATLKEVQAVLEEKAIEWGHDESLTAVRNKVRTLIERGTNFSCEKVRGILEELGMEHHCLGCSASKNSGIWIARNIIQTMYYNKAAVRHFEMYLNLEKNNLIGVEIDPVEENINLRTLKEWAKFAEAKITKIKKTKKYVIEVDKEKAKYRLPINFIETVGPLIGESIKQYLMLVVNTHSGNDEVVHSTMGISTIQEYLRYKTIDGVEKLLKKLENAGLFYFNKKSGFTIRFKSNKIVSLVKKLEEKKKNIQDDNSGNEENKVAVNQGIQLNFDFENQKNNINVHGNEYKNVIFVGKDNQFGGKRRRGSPSTIRN